MTTAPMPSEHAPQVNAADAHVFRPAAESAPLDEARLAAYLAGIGLPLDTSEPVRQFGTGLANINYRLTAGGRRLVLRRPPGGDLPPGAHDMSREHRILSRLWRVHPLAPESLHLCEDRSVIGVPFQLIDYRPGLVIKGDDRSRFDGRPDVELSPDGRFRIDRLIPGQAYDADVYRNFKHLGKAFDDLVLQPGEARDLGDVRAPASNP